jgi:hypothetical protein
MGAAYVADPMPSFAQQSGATGAGNNATVGGVEGGGAGGLNGVGVGSSTLGGVQGGGGTGGLRGVGGYRGGVSIIAIAPGGAGVGETAGGGGGAGGGGAVDSALSAKLNLAIGRGRDQA